MCVCVILQFLFAQREGWSISTQSLTEMLYLNLSIHVSASFIKHDSILHPGKNASVLMTGGPTDVAGALSV